LPVAAVSRYAEFVRAAMNRLPRVGTAADVTLGCRAHRFGDTEFAAGTGIGQSASK
jgi:hypothetical protein